MQTNAIKSIKKELDWTYENRCMYYTSIKTKTIVSSNISTNYIIFEFYIDKILGICPFLNEELKML